MRIAMLVRKRGREKGEKLKTEDYEKGLEERGWGNEIGKEKGD